MFKQIVFVIATALTYQICQFSSPITDIDDTDLVCPIVDTTLGPIAGASDVCGEFCEYCKYIGIPYASPPLGDLRFRAPQPHPGWGTNVYYATLYGNTCLYNEDCLFLNIYSKSIDSNGLLPVMFWIHGGAFYAGSGDGYGPNYLINEDVLLVTINYRLGVFGFLSTGDEFAPGNYGLKDTVMALKWVKENIREFGGDPDNITIFGESAGGAIVHYLLLSPVTKGLFSKAISQSGSALNSWSFQSHPENITQQLATALQIDFTDNEDLVNQLRQSTVVQLLIAANSISNPTPSGFHPIPFSPSVDPINTSADEIFLPNSPNEILKSNDYNHVPYLLGFNNEEWLRTIIDVQSNPAMITIMNSEPHRLIPASWNIDPESTEAQDIIYAIREFYFNAQELSMDLSYEFSTLTTDVMFIVGIDKTARLHSVNQRFPVYYYKFSFDGDLNMARAALGLPDGEYPGAVHADEIYYLFSISYIPPTLPISDETALTRQRLVQMWTNFAKNSNPTVSMDPITTTRWMPVRHQQECLHINETLLLERFPLQERMEFWHNLEEKYLN